MKLEINGEIGMKYPPAHDVFPFEACKVRAMAWDRAVQLLVNEGQGIPSIEQIIVKAKEIERYLTGEV